MMKNRLLTLLASNRGRSIQPRQAIVAQSDEATLYIYDVIVSSEAEAQWFGGVAAETLAKEIRGLSVSTIHVRINSPGGGGFGGQTIASALRDSRARVIAHVDGLAASAATIVATAADEIVMAKGSMYMVHRAWLYMVGNMHDLLDAASLLEKFDRSMAEQYAGRTGESVEDMLAVMDVETWFTAEEAVEAKFVDRIADDEPKAKAEWDLSAYINAPASQPVALEQSQEHRDRQQQRVRLLDLAPIG